MGTKAVHACMHAYTFAEAASLRPLDAEGRGPREDDVEATENLRHGQLRHDALVPDDPKQPSGKVVASRYSLCSYYYGTPRLDVTHTTEQFKTAVQQQMAHQVPQSPTVTTRSPSINVPPQQQPIARANQSNYLSRKGSPLELPASRFHGFPTTSHPHTGRCGKVGYVRDVVDAAVGSHSGADHYIYILHVVTPTGTSNFFVAQTVCLPPREVSCRVCMNAVILHSTVHQQRLVPRMVCN